MLRFALPLKRTRTPSPTHVSLISKLLEESPHKSTQIFNLDLNRATLKQIYCLSLRLAIFFVSAELEYVVMIDLVIKNMQRVKLTAHFLFLLENSKLFFCSLQDR